jgi:outer membrane protein assembly factor BamE (lipoprotein component of BamABCDE complex)
MKRKGLYVLAALALLAGCATADKMNGLSIGMTREQVISVMGAPDTTGAQGNNEYLVYRLSDTKLESLVGFTEPYVVELKEGKVDAFGKRSGVFLR